ncbi:MAG: LysM peptidoglycan-binding domain-containing protein [Bacteroidota bacterium]
MYAKAALIFLLGICTNLSLWGQQVPAQIEYCGTTLHLAPGVQTQISEYISQIYKSPRYFNEMVRRAHLYMPMIEQAFRGERIPEDLKYIAIQESGLRPSVVSSSQAVGFWQFKEPTAHDMGLMVNDKVDERQHIYRASQAAAKYLSNANWDFNNWIYAVIAYYEGPTGSVKHTDPQYYGKDTMKIEEGFHWYALKAIAHKLAYEDAVQNQMRSGLRLEAHNADGGTSVRQLIASHDVEDESFYRHNPWLLESKKLPKDGIFMYFVPKEGGQTIQMGQSTDASPQEKPASLVIQDMTTTEMELAQAEADPIPVPAPSQESEQSPVLPTPTPATASLSEMALPPSQYPGARSKLPENASGYVVFDLSQDLHYNHQYIHFDGSKTMTQIADRYSRRLSQLLVWNGLLPGQQPVVGSMVYLMKPSKQEYHIVRIGESLEDIGRLHLIKPRKLQKLNNQKKNNKEIYVGQKLYLKKRKPKNEKMIVLRAPEFGPSPTVNMPDAENQPSAAQPAGESSSPNQATASYQDVRITDQASSNETQISVEAGEPSVKEVKTRWITHRVREGETLWQISQKYGTKVEIIKMINKMNSDSISEGQSLRILAKEEFLLKLRQSRQ